MLGKYWSIFLLAGMGLSVLFDKRRVAYFRSAAPWITTGAEFIALAPHLFWLVRSDFKLFSYAMTSTATSRLPPRSLPRSAICRCVRVHRRSDGHRLCDQTAEREDRSPTFCGRRKQNGGSSRLHSGVRCCCRRSLRSWAVPNYFTVVDARFLAVAGAFVVVVRGRDTRTDTRRILLAAALPVRCLCRRDQITAQRAGRRRRPRRRRCSQAKSSGFGTRRRHNRCVLSADTTDIAYGVAAYAAERPRALTGMPEPPASEIARSGLFGYALRRTDCRRKAVPAADQQPNGSKPRSCAIS